MYNALVKFEYTTVGMPKEPYTHITNCQLTTIFPVNRGFMCARRKKRPFSTRAKTHTICRLITFLPTNKGKGEGGGIDIVLHFSRHHKMSEEKYRHTPIAD